MGQSGASMGGYTSEFMIEDDLSLDRCTGLDFVKHHEIYCRPYGLNCEDRKNQPTSQRTGGRILSFVLGNAQHVLDTLLKPADGMQPYTELDTAYDGLETQLTTKVKFGGGVSSESNCQHVVRGALALYGSDQLDRAKNLLGLISSEENFTKALTEIVRTHFNDPAWKPFRD